VRRYLAIGDEYTAGVGVPEGEAWPRQLCTLLAGQQLPVDELVMVTPRNCTTAEMLDELERSPPDGAFDLVTVQVGTADAKLGLEHLPEFAPAFRRLLTRAIEFAGGDGWHVVVVTPPHWSLMDPTLTDRGELSRLIDVLVKFGTVEFMETISKEQPHYANVTDESLKILSEPALLCELGLHPTAACYREWAELVARSAAHLLVRPAPGEHELHPLDAWFEGLEQDDRRN
jgi:lysophospholipase L1-like esterase